MFTSVKQLFNSVKQLCPWVKFGFAKVNNTITGVNIGKTEVNKSKKNFGFKDTSNFRYGRYTLVKPR